MEKIERTQYLDKLIAFKDKKIMKVITGIRRCGKSTMMEMYQEYLLSHGVLQEQIIAINLEDYDYYELRDPMKLHAYIKERLVDGKQTYIFIDEIQQCESFPRVVDSLYIKKDTDLYLTGSNAYMLSSELATLLSGRYVEIAMLPLSFYEYVKATKNEANLALAYREYLETSSFPYVLELRGQPKEIRDYLDSIYNTIVVKDISKRKKIVDSMMLESIARFVFDNIGSQMSTKKIADTMTSNGRKIDVKTVERYVHGLVESFIIYQAKRYNIKGKQYLKTLDKYYVADIGMRNMLLGTRAADVGHVLENVIYLELIRRGYDVYVGKIDDLEIEFVAMEQKSILYVQVAATVRDEKTLTRELASLQKIKDHYPKLLLTLDEDPEADYDGIRRLNALDWLMDTTR
ncbi:ATP-binding protein [[Clostridium] innocuum]|nr:ATP-binding protein [[Clostridium] innocuum]